MVDVHTKADKLQTMVVAFNVLFDVFKILSIELHRKKGNDFYSTCLVLGRKGNEDNATTAVLVGTNGVITMVI